MLCAEGAREKKYKLESVEQPSAVLTSNAKAMYRFSDSTRISANQQTEVFTERQESEKR